MENAIFVGMDTTEEKWGLVSASLTKRFGKAADVKAALYVIGLREWGKKKTKKITKEEKLDLMNLAACKILSPDGYFEVQHLDAEGWPVWKQAKALPPMTTKEQELFLMEHIYKYFESERLL